MTVDVASGVTAILLTPFGTGDQVDLDALADQAQAAVRWGAVAVGFGFASEVHRLTQAERDAAVATVAAAVPQGVPVMAHVWESSREALRARLDTVAERGATLAMVPAPLVVAPTDAELEAFFRDAADASPIPLVLQDAPALAGSAITADVLARMLDHPNVAAVKVEALPSASKIERISRAARQGVGVVGGAGGLDVWHELGRGASGTMPSAAIPEPFVRILELHRTGAGDAALAMWTRMLPFLVVSQRSFDTYVVAQKHVLLRRGVLSSIRLRGPNEPADPSLIRELDQLWPLLSALLEDVA